MCACNCLRDGLTDIAGESVKGWREFAYISSFEVKMYPDMIVKIIKKILDDKYNLQRLSSHTEI